VHEYASGLTLTRKAELFLLLPTQKNYRSK